jgi:hypothetical protein
MRHEAPCHIPGTAGRESEGCSLGLMPYLDPKGEGNNSMAGKQRPCPGVWNGALRDPRDMVKAGLPEPQSPDDVISPSAGKTPVTGAASYAGVSWYPAYLRGRGTISSEGIQGDEWGTYAALSRMTGTNVGSPKGREPYGDAGLVVVAGVTPRQGGRESRPQGEGGQVDRYPKAGRYA